MDKKDALLILLNQTKLFNDEVKSSIAASISGMDDNQIHKLGNILVSAHEDTVMNIGTEISSIDSIISMLDTQVLTLG